MESFAKSVRNLINYSIEKRLISKDWGLELKEVLKIRKMEQVPSYQAIKPLNLS